MRSTRLLWLTIALLGAPTAALLGAPTAALGQTVLPPNEDLVCAPETPELTDTEYLRSVSLDLRGRVPTVAEYEANADASMREAMLAEWTASEAFVSRVVRRHRALLWNNVSNVTIVSAGAQLGTSGNLYFVSNRATTYRGDNIACLDEPARWDTDGRIVTTAGVSPRGVPVQQEGFVLVRPYWAPTTEVKVCAYDAQSGEYSRRGTLCASSAGLSDTGCGCGASLNHCASTTQSNLIARQFGLELERRIAAVMRDGGRYHELFTSRRTFVNGPLVHLYRHLSKVPGPVSFRPLPFDEADLPNLAFGETEHWVEMELPEQHAGILTSPAFLLRFQTNRARASRFADAFLCDPYTPPAGGIPASTDAEARQVDLQQRTGCLYCHAQLEPAASFWGRWTQVGAGWLDPATYPSRRDDCYDCAIGRTSCSTECSQRYVTRALAPEQRPYLGMLQPFEFRRPEHMTYVDEGPARLVREGMADGRLPHCVARRTTEWLLGREVTESEMPWLEGVTREFVSSGMQFSTLVTDVVSHPTYRRAR